MKIIKTFEQIDLLKSQKELINGVQKGKCTDWKRTFFLMNLHDQQVALISLNLFERIAWKFQEVLCRGKNYSKFERIFNTKNTEIVSNRSLQVLSVIGNAWPVIKAYRKNNLQPQNQCGTAEKEMTTDQTFAPNSVTKL